MRSIHPAPARHARALPIADVLRPVEIVSDHSAMLRLGSMTAQERLAAFLLDLTGGSMRAVSPTTRCCCE